MSKPIIECEVYLNASYGKATLSYVPTCEKGKKLLAYMASKDERIKGNAFTPTVLPQVLTMVDIKCIKVPSVPVLPKLNDVVKSKVELPDFLK